jgi:DNA invertase Pin-like site-specific DNA recombinase
VASIIRLLPVIRLSLLTDETTSPKRQLGSIKKWVGANDETYCLVEGKAEDLDVSGAVSPFARKELGAWLKEERLKDWDGLIVAKLDRLSRSLKDFVLLWEWLDARGKTLVCLDPQIDMTSPMGRALAKFLMTFAELERDMIAARVKDAYTHLKASGQYAGGVVPFGFRPVDLRTKGKDNGWGYEADPEYAPVVQEMASKYLDGESLGQIARWLNSNNVPTPKNAMRLRNATEEKPAKLRTTKWKFDGVKDILRSWIILGAVTNAYGEPLRDSDGSVIYRASSLISRDQFDAIRARIDKQANTGIAHVNSAMLSKIAHCGECNSVMHLTNNARVMKTDGSKKTYYYYKCKLAKDADGSCNAKAIRADVLEPVVEHALIKVIGDIPVQEERFIKGFDYSEEVDRLGDELGTLHRKIELGSLANKDVSAEQERLEILRAEIRRIASKEAVPDRTEKVITDETFRQRWERLPASQRTAFLLDAGIKVRAKHWNIDMPDIGADYTSFNFQDNAVVVHIEQGIYMQVELGRYAELRELAGKP